MSDARKQMNPTSLEMVLLILKLNSDLWDERSVNAVIKRCDPQRTERDISSTPISTVSSSSSSTAQPFFSTSGNRQRMSECDDDDNGENDEDDENC